MEALRFNEGKPELGYILFYPRFLEALARVQEQGEVKYGFANWTSGGKPDFEYYNSGLRHLIEHFNGEMYDKDSGVIHIAHAIWNFMNLLERNLPDIPLKNPDFDQEAYVERWKDFPKNTVREK